MHTTSALVLLSRFLFRTSTISGQRKEGGLLLLALLAVGISIKSIVQGAIALLLLLLLLRSGVATGLLLVG